MEFYISPQSGQFYMINVLENQWLSVTLVVCGTVSVDMDLKDLLGSIVSVGYGIPGPGFLSNN